MNTLQSRKCILTTAVVLCALISGCSHNIKYPLDAEATPPSPHPTRMNVAVVALDDARESTERQKSDREARGDTDVGDYTYDKDFGGDVAPSISEMMAGHLTFAGAFNEVRLLDGTAAVTPKILDSLEQQGVDAVLTGKLENFYGYYDQRPGKKTLAQVGLGLLLALPVTILTTSTETTPIYGPTGQIGEMSEVNTSPLAIGLAVGVGVALGTFIESSSSRDIAWHTRLSLELLDTATGKTLWTGTTDVQQEEHKAMPGIKTDNRKQQVAVNSLQAAVNDLVIQLSQAQLQMAANDAPDTGS